MNAKKQIPPFNNWQKIKINRRKCQCSGKQTKQNKNQQKHIKFLPLLFWSWKYLFCSFSLFTRNILVLDTSSAIREKNNIGFPTSGPYSKEDISNTTLNLLSDLLILDLLIYYSFKINIFLYLKAAVR